MQSDHKKYPVSVYSTSAAFDTTDHDILITRCSSFHGSILNWFKLYLFSRSFPVQCSNSLSSPAYDVPQGSVLRPRSRLLFIMYTTPLQVISIHSPHLNHSTIYADDTQLFFSFIHLIFILASPTSRLLYKKSLPG